MLRTVNLPVNTGILTPCSTVSVLTVARRWAGSSRRVPPLPSTPAKAPPLRITDSLRKRKLAQKQARSRTFYRPKYTWDTYKDRTGKPLQELKRFSEIDGMEPTLLKNLEIMGITAPTSVQARGLAAFQDTDNHLVIVGETGSGKTMNYCLPIILDLQRKAATMNRSTQSSVFTRLGTGKNPLADNSRGTGGSVGKSYRYCILQPNTELVEQCARNLTFLSQGLSVPAVPAVCYPGHRLIADATSNVLVTTPTQLLPYAHEDLLQDTELFVVDEADLLYHPDFVAATKEVAGFLPGSGHRSAVNRRRYLFLGATMPSEGPLSVLSQICRHVRDAILIESFGAHRVVPTIEEEFVKIDPKHKDAFLQNLLQECEDQSMIIFVQNKPTASKLSAWLRRLKIDHALLAGNISEQERLRDLGRFARRECSILLATDMAARGIDVPHVDHVVMYHPPETVVSYVHRTGRTARGPGRSGRMTMLCPPEGTRISNWIERNAKDVLAEAYSRNRNFPKKLRKTEYEEKKKALMSKGKSRYQDTMANTRKELNPLRNGTDSKTEERVDS
eukprot:Clim_evm47s77 gene=Clim_evmTU47s77